MHYKNRPGQIGLMLLVVMAVVISLVMSIAARSLSDVSLSRQEKENSSTFALAESGVEKALSDLTVGSDIPISDVTTGQISGKYSVNLSSFDMHVKEGETAQIDLTGASGTVTVAWVKTGENPGCSTPSRSGTVPAALEISLISSTNVVTRYYYNARGCSDSSNGFLNTAAAGSGGFGSSAGISVGSNVIMRIKPLYYGTTIKVSGSSLNSQLYLITSNAEGGDARTDIEVKRTQDAAGSIFDYALFSNTTITKN